MRLRRLTRLIPGVAVAAGTMLGGSASATHCPTFKQYTVNTVAQGTWYVDDRDFFGVYGDIPAPVGRPGQPGDGLWIYKEANGAAGLQQGGPSAIFGSLPPPAGPGSEVCNHASHDQMYF